MAGHRSIATPRGLLELALQDCAGIPMDSMQLDFTGAST